MKIFDFAKSLFKVASAAVVVTSVGCAGPGNEVVVNQNSSSEFSPQAATEQGTSQTNANLPATANQYTSEQGSTVKVGQITWFENYDDALVVAKKQNKPLWLHFGENPG